MIYIKLKFMFYNTFFFYRIKKIVLTFAKIIHKLNILIWEIQITTIIQLIITISH